MKFIKENWDKILMVAFITMVFAVNVDVIMGCDGETVRGLFSFVCLRTNQ